MLLGEAVHFADQCHTSYRNAACCMFDFAVKTRETETVFLWKANAVKALLPFDYAGVHWT
jgi:hypothetical protein